MNNLTFEELHEQMKSTPIALLNTAIDNLEIHECKLRTLYRSQLFQDDIGTTQTLGIADGTDSEFIIMLYEENKKTLNTLYKAVAALRASDDKHKGDGNAD